MTAREVVLDDEVPRLKQAAVVLLSAGLLLVTCALVISPLAFLDDAPFPPIAIGGSTVSLIAALGSVAVLRSPTNPAARRLAFLSSLPIVFVLVPLLLAVTFAVDQAGVAAFAGYSLQLMVTIGAVWSAYVLWPVVEVRPA